LPADRRLDQPQVKPPGPPHPPPEPEGAEEAEEHWEEKTEKTFSESLPPHLGQEEPAAEADWFPPLYFSKVWLHLRQRYSNIGIVTSS
jgi:hypothetical protein